MTDIFYETVIDTEIVGARGIILSIAGGDSSREEMIASTEPAARSRPSGSVVVAADAGRLLGATAA